MQFNKETKQNLYLSSLTYNLFQLYQARLQKESMKSYSIYQYYYIFYVYTLYTLLLASFSHQHKLMVFHRILSDSKSPLVSRLFSVF